MRKLLSIVYRAMNATSLGASFIGWFYTRKKYPKTPPVICGGKPDLPRIAFVCDEMTWQNFKEECNAVFVTPANWREAFEKFKPEIFFCESAWRGIEAEKNCWDMRVWKNPKSRYENRKDLFNIVKYCKENGIKTVFWNKEDPTNFDVFVETALWFDYIFTTAEECIPRYKSRGCYRVYLLSFGVSDRIFYFDGAIKKENTAVFAGSWFADHPERCKDMRGIFDLVLAKNIELIIYDRQSGTKHSSMKYPEKYQKYIHPSVAYDELGNIYRKSRYAITINTVTDSETMFARRVFEIMACGCVVISNESKGLRAMFGKRIWFYRDDFDSSKEAEIVQQNVREVMEKHTCGKRMREMLSYLLC